MVNSNSLKSASPKTTNELTESHSIVDFGKKAQDTVQKVGTIGAIALAIIVGLVIVLIIKKKKKG